jgi:hypothetical protein
MSLTQIPNFSRRQTKTNQVYDHTSGGGFDESYPDQNRLTTKMTDKAAVKLPQLFGN